MGISLVTGSGGHLGEALVRVLRQRGRPVRGLDIIPSPFTDVVGSICDPELVRSSLQGVDVILHAATLHKPHVGTHSHSDFVQTNIQGTLNLLEAAVQAQVRGMVFTSTTSTFGAALKPGPEAPAAWITEEVRPVPKNIYGVTKVAAEDLCQLFWRNHGFPTQVLRTSRFFLEADDHPDQRSAFDDNNLKANEFLYRRVEISDAVEAHLLALEQLHGFGRYVISATTPFAQEQLERLRGQAEEVVEELFPGTRELYRARGWRMHSDIERVYVNQRARRELGWKPRYDFAYVLECLREGRRFWSDLAVAVGTKGYHPGRRFEDGPYPVA